MRNPCVSHLGSPAPSGCRGWLDEEGFLADRFLLRLRLRRAVFIRVHLRLTPSPFNSQPSTQRSDQRTLRWYHDQSAVTGEKLIECHLQLLHCGDRSCSLFRLLG